VSRLLSRKTAAIMATLCCLMVFVMLFRYRAGSHYLPVSIQIDGLPGFEQATADVRVISPFGTLRALTRDAHGKHLFRSPDFVNGPISGVAISGVSAENLKVASVYAVMGSSAVGLGRRIHLVAETVQPGTIDEDSGGVRFGPLKVPGSLLKVAGRSFNWQGDMWFVLVCFAQAILLLAWGGLAGTLLQRKPATVGQWSFVDRCVAGPLLIILMVQLWFCVQQFLKSVDAAETVTAVCLAGVVLAACWLIRNPKRVFRRIEPVSEGQTMVLLAVTLLVVRMLATVGVSTYQSGDYATYWRMSGLMAEGRAAEINNGWSAVEMMSIRAFLFGLPVRHLLGNSVVWLWMVNSALLVLAALFLYNGVRREFGRNAGVISAVGFSLHPDVLFGGNLCRHETPALFYLSALFALLPFLWSHAYKSVRAVKNTAFLVAVAVVCGGLTALLEGQRSYMPFLLCSFCLCFFRVGVAGFGACVGGRPFWHSGLGITRWSLVFLVLVSTAISVNGFVTRYVRDLVGTYGTNYMNWHMLAAMETETEQTFADFVPFSAYYAPSVPSQYVNQFVLRKMMFEKVASGGQLWFRMYRKISWVSGTESAIKGSGSAVVDEVFPARFFVPFVTLRSAWGTSWFCFLLIAGILRLLRLPVLPFSVWELFPFVFSSVFLVALLLLAEAGEQYDIFLALPLAVAAGRLLSWDKPAEVQSDPSGFSSPGWPAVVRYFLPPLVLLVVVAVIQLAAAAALRRHPEMTFAAPVTIVSDSHGVAEVSRCAAVLHTERLAELQAGQSVSCKFAVPASSFSTNVIRFFLSADQRRQGMVQLPLPADLPLVYELRIDGNPVAGGTLQELISPSFQIARVDPNADVRTVELRVTATDSLDASQLSQAFRVAVEYLH
jgi:hypothetical protein